MSRGLARGVAYVVCPPLRCVVCRGHAQYPFAPDSSKVVVGFFHLFDSFAKNLL